MQRPGPYLPGSSLPVMKGSCIKESFLVNSNLYALFIAMHDAHPLIYRSASSLHMDCISSDTLRAEPFQVTCNGLDLALKLDWNTLMPTTADTASSYFFLSLRITTKNNRFTLVKCLLFINVTF